MKKAIFLLAFLTTSLLSAQGISDGFYGWGSLGWTFPEGDAEYINVTSLEDAGTGTLRDACTRPSSNAGRIITFYGISGQITLNAPIDIGLDNVYIAAHTSPNGITLKSNGTQNNALLRTTNSPDGVIVRGMALRRGPGAQKEVNGDAITLLSGSHIILANLSLGWSTDEVLNIYGANDVTVQDVLMHEPLMFSTHAYTTDPTSSAYYRPHAMATLIGNASNRISWKNVLIAHANQRSLLIGGGVDPGLQHEVSGFVSYNWGDFGFVVSNIPSMSVNITNYVGISGANTRNNRYSLATSGNVKFYVNSTWNNKRTSTSQTDWESVGLSVAPYDSPYDIANQLLTPNDYPLKDDPALTRQQIIDMVLARAGSPYNDAIDQRIKNDVRNGTGTLIDDPSEVGGWITPPENGAMIIDSDNDGIPDSEEGNFTTLFDYVNSLIGTPASPAFVALTDFGITETSENIIVGGTVQLTAITLPTNASNKSDSWTSSDVSVATVSANGLVTGVSGGTATITRTSLDDSNDPVLSDTMTVNVTDNAIPVTGVSIDPVNLYPSTDNVQLTANVFPLNATDDTIVWESSDDDVAVVSENGLVTYSGNRGEVEIFVTTLDGGFVDVVKFRFYPKRKRMVKVISNN